MEINIWNNKSIIKNGENFTPYMTFHKSENSVGKAILILPGGGYYDCCDTYEGEEFAQYFNSIGVDAFVLRYTTTSKNNNKPIYPLPFIDATRAMRYIRSHGKEININPDCIGIIGFSAGAHLASWVSTKWDDKPKIYITDELNNNYKKINYSESNYPDDLYGEFSARPDFSILCYGVLDLNKITDYSITGVNLLGSEVQENIINSLSSPMNVTKSTPPTYLFHTYSDQVVPVMNSIKYYEALVNNGVPSEIHTYVFGKHGMGLGTPLPHETPQESKYCSKWSNQLTNWILNL